MLWLIKGLGKHVHLHSENPHYSYHSFRFSYPVQTLVIRRFVISLHFLPLVLAAVAPSTTHFSAPSRFHQSLPSLVVTISYTFCCHSDDCRSRPFVFVALSRVLMASEGASVWVSTHTGNWNRPLGPTEQGSALFFFFAVSAQKINNDHFAVFIPLDFFRLVIQLDKSN